MNSNDILTIGEYNTPIALTWDIIDYCQLNCTYCSSAGMLVRGNIKQNSECKTKTWRYVLAKLRLFKNKFKICLAGGEPTLHPDIVEITESLNNIDNLIEVILNTNICNVNVINNLNHDSLNKTIIVPSYHYEYNNMFQKNIHKLTKKIKTIVAVNIPTDVRYWSLTKDTLKMLRKHNIKYKITFLHSTSEFKSDYDNSVFDYFEDDLRDCMRVSAGSVSITTDLTTTCSYTDFIKNKLNYLKGWTCNSNTYVIDIKGDIRNACNGAMINSIMNKHNFSQCIKCPHDICIDERNFNFHKTKPDNK